VRSGSGLPRPVSQARIATPRGTFDPDCPWERQRPIGARDGAVKDGRAGAYVREKERERALRDAGFRIVRWLAMEIMTAPEEVVARVSRSLAG